MATRQRAPPATIFQKYRAEAGSSKNHMREYGDAATAWQASVKERSMRPHTHQMQTTMAATRLIDCSVSVGMSERTTSSCITAHTTYIFNEEPMIFETKKHHAPVRCVVIPKRSLRYWYRETTPCR